MKEGVRMEFVHGGNVWREGRPDKWIDFSANLNPKGPPQVMLDAIKENLDKIVYYPEVNMESPSRNIGEYLGVDSDKILPTSGGIGALALITDELRPSTIAILQPGFVEYLRLARNVGAEVINIAIIDKDGTLSYPEDEMKKVLKENTMLFICNPSNPIGTTISSDILVSILKTAQQNKAHVVVDEAFIDFAEGESVRGLVDEYSSLIIAGSLTKIFAIPGIRLGYICANESFIRKLKQRQTPWSLSSFASDVTGVLHLTKEYVLDSLRDNEAQKKYLTDSLKSLGIQVYPSKTNFLFLSLKSRSISVKELQEALLKERILIRDCSNYVYLDEYYCRIAIKSQTDNERLISAIKTCLKG